VPHRSRLLVSAAAALAAAAVFAPLSAAAEADTSDFELRSFTGEYELSRAENGTSRVTVTETIVPVFPDFDQNRGIVRAIPDLYQGIPLHTEVRSVENEAGEPVPYEAGWDEDRGFVELALGTDEFVQGEQTYVIEYTQRNVVGTFSDTDADEFYWNVNGTEWDQPFGEVAALVTLDTGLAGALTGEAACYVGERGATTQCGIQQTDADGITAFTARAAGLAPHETMTFAIGLASGTFVQAEPDPDYVSIYQPRTPPWSNVVAILGLILSGLVVLAALVVRLLPDGGARGRGTIIPEYSVPDDLNVMAAAHLVGKPATAISAQLISLAVRRRIRLLDYPVKGDAEYAVQLIDPTGVDPLEERVLRALFGDLTPGESRDLPKTDTALAKALQKASKAAAKSLRTQGLVEPVPRWMRGGWLRTTAVVLLLAALVNSFFVVPEGTGGTVKFVATVGAVVALVLVAILSRKPTRFTGKGAERNDYLRGMKLYLEVAEEDRIRMLQSPEGAERVDLGERVTTLDRVQLVKLYERLLPFAVIWGVEEEWMDQLAVRMEEAHTSPDWFAGRNGFSSGAVVSTLHGVGRTASVTSTSSGGSSFSGGSGGGGFAGGGGGGGGGGGR
jgi:uncharacterized protein (TIGR04222 family)